MSILNKEMRYKLHRSFNTSGFTLIELLIVIAVIGVLAAVVITAINPLEQLAKSRDAGRRNSVEQLGKALSAYTTSVTGGTYPTAAVLTALATGAGNTWQNGLVAVQELKGVIVAPTITTQCSVSASNGFCYAPIGTTDATIWTLSESGSEKAKAGCTGTQVTAIAWVASQGKVGVTCLTNAATAPAANAVLN